MKKFSKWLLILATLVIAALSAFAFAACGDDKGGDNTPDPSACAGTYKFVRLTEDSKTYNVGDQYLENAFNGKVTLSADSFVMELAADGKFNVNSFLSQRDPAYSANCNQIYGNMTGTWTTDKDSGIKVTINDTTINMLSLADNEIKYMFNIGLNSVTIYLQKV